MIIYDFKEIARRSISIIILSTALTDLQLLLILKEFPLRLHKKFT